MFDSGKEASFCISIEFQMCKEKREKERTCLAHTHHT